ncbi:MAG: hypothetical protein ABIG43_02060 [Chloroflexota bacterium]
MKNTNPINLITILGGVLLALTLAGVGFILISFSGQARQVLDASSGAAVTLIPAPTATPILALPADLPAATPTEASLLPKGVIGIGAYVQVSGTDGTGLRMRVEAGVASEVSFVALDAEVFLVIDGPLEKDGYIWWHLEAPYDQTRNGWSADAFLMAIDSPADQ